MGPRKRSVLRRGAGLLACAGLLYLLHPLDLGANERARTASKTRQVPQQQRIPRQARAQKGGWLGVVRNFEGRPVAGASVGVQDTVTHQAWQATTKGDGIFRLIDLPAGIYSFQVQAEGYEGFSRSEVRLSAGEIITLEVTLKSISTGQSVPRLRPRPEAGPQPSPPPPPALPPPGTYRELRRRGEGEPAAEAPMIPLPPDEEVFIARPDRWTIELPEYNRYGKKGDWPFVRGRWYDPYNTNKIKGDKPIIGQRTFFAFSGLSETVFAADRVPLPSSASSARPGSEEFFGKGELFAVVQNVRLGFELYHGDTSFRPADWRIRVTPTVNLNYVNTKEHGIINVNVTQGTDRVDSHVGLQEAFFEVKLFDLSPNYDFLSVRAGIQSFTSDFRGFLFFDEQPGVRIFGNVHSNKWEYNLAYFNLLEKDTNSGLNSFERRGQQVMVANFYMQDFVKPGYTTEFSFHYNKDDPSFHFDRNGFLVRPAPVGIFTPHRVEALYLGWAGSGHFRRINVTHAFYQAFGADQLNPISGRKVTINAQFAAAEFSLDKDWLRFRASFVYASGDANPRDGRARGFDSIVDVPTFAGGPFSFWNREGIRLTGTGVALVNPNSLLPSLRSSKEEGQANFINPGLWLLNGGMDVDLTTRLKGVINFNYLRFDRTEPLELLLFQAPIHHTIGFDSGLGFQYRPRISENIVIIGGASALLPGQGFRDIYSGKMLFSVFLNARFQF